MSNRIPVVVPLKFSRILMKTVLIWWKRQRELVARLEGRLDAKFRVELEEYGKWKSLRDLTAKHSGH